MSRKKKTGATGAAPSRVSDVEQARNDLFGHVHRCGVLRATEEQQLEWMNDTIGYIGECYPSLSEAELEELKTIGLRFCRPVIANGAPAAPTVDASADDAEDLSSEEELSDEESLSVEEASAA